MVSVAAPGAPGRRLKNRFGSRLCENGIESIAKDNQEYPKRSRCGRFAYCERSEVVSMTRYIEGSDRRQAFLLPECLDDYVCEDNPIRVIEAFVDELDLGGLGFERAVPAETGAPATTRRSC